MKLQWLTTHDLIHHSSPRKGESTKGRKIIRRRGISSFFAISCFRVFVVKMGAWARVLQVLAILEGAIADRGPPAEVVRSVQGQSAAVYGLMQRTGRRRKRAAFPLSPTRSSDVSPRKRESAKGRKIGKQRRSSSFFALLRFRLFVVKTDAWDRVLQVATVSPATRTCNACGSAS
jgi:hypothetical protein